MSRSTPWMVGLALAGLAPRTYAQDEPTGTTDLTAGELGAAGRVVEEGAIVVPALFGRFRAPVGGPFEISSNVAQDLAGPNLELKAAVVTTDTLGLALTTQGWALWKGNGFGGDVGLGFTYGGPTDSRVNASLRYGALRTVARIETLEINEKQKTLNTALGYDWMLNPKSALVFSAGVDLLSFDAPTGVVAAGSAHFVHGWEKLRLSVGADLVRADIPELGDEAVDKYIPDGALIPFPHLNLWWKL